MGIQNWSANGTPDLSWFENNEWLLGSMWILGQNAGDPVTVTSNGPDYTYVNSDLTNLYNFPNAYNPTVGATDVTQATRSVLWLNSDYLVIYDRATTMHSGLFKNFNMCLQEAPVISGNVATETMPDGQQFFIQSLLPATPTLMSFYGAGNLNIVADLEPMQYVITVHDPTLSADSRFLTVLQGADKGSSIVPATHSASLTGTAFDGAVFGANAVFFPVKSNSTLTTTTFLVPAKVTKFFVTGLTPGASYGVSTTASSLGITVTLTPGGTGSIADTTGVLHAAI
jgi:hypothetical protein